METIRNFIQNIIGYFIGYFVDPGSPSYPSEKPTAEKDEKIGVYPAPAIKQIKKCAVVGAGLMGSGIARLLSFYNIPVILKEKDQALLERALELTTFKGGSPYEDAKDSPAQNAAVSPLVTGTTDYLGLKDADLVIEAVPEDIRIKEEVLEEISKVVGSQTIIASNTSSLSISGLSEHVRHPERFLGMHFFYPADKRELVEVIRGKATGEAAANEAASFLRQLGKIPIIVKDGPGFLVNRVVVIYLTEAINCLADGMKAEDIDRIMLDFGMPVGPFHLMDLVGVELSYEIGKVVLKGLARPGLKLPALLIDRYNAYRKGKDVPWNTYGTGRKKTNKGRMSAEQCLDRIAHTIINEASRCMEEGVVAEPKLLDLGLTLGTGFPNGGPLKYADSVGLSKIVECLDNLKQMHGERFKCSELLRKMAAANKNFYKVQPPVTKPVYKTKEIPIPVTVAPEGRIKKILYKGLKIFDKLFFGLLYRVEVEGLENMPVGGSAIFASNHASFLDPMLLLNIIPRRCHSIAGSWLFKIIFISWVIRTVDSIPAEGSISLSIAALNRGDAVLIFPEGRCRCSKEKFGERPRKGVAVLALKTGAPIIPIYITGTFEAYPEGKIFPRFFKKLKVRIGKPFKLNKYKDEVIPVPILENALQDIMASIKRLAE